MKQKDLINLVQKYCKPDDEVHITVRGVWKEDGIYDLEAELFMFHPVEVTKEDAKLNMIYPGDKRATTVPLVIGTAGWTLADPFYKRAVNYLKSKLKIQK
jgi:hypothetical protein